MIIGHTDDKLDQLLRAHYHTAIDGIEAPETLVRAVLATASPRGGLRGAWAPLLAFTLAGASFVIILASSRAIEILLNL
ncbi:MAG: hypothetical protein ACYDHF_08490 [Candidatus Cryosericum sp.]